MPKKLQPSGGYRKTVSFQTATIIYDATYWFCEKYLHPRSRTVDQMVQAARSGQQKPEKMLAINFGAAQITLSVKGLSKL